MLDHQMRNTDQLMFGKAPIFHERNGSKPKLGKVAITLYMDVGRFTSVGTEEHKAVRPIYKHGGHKGLLFRELLHYELQVIFPENAEACQCGLTLLIGSRIHARLNSILRAPT